MLADLAGGRTPVEWDRAAFPYLVTVCWDDRGGADPLIVVQSRDQRRMRILTADRATGTTSLLREDTDPHWVDIVPGVPAWTAERPDRLDGDRRRHQAAGRGHPGGTVRRPGRAGDPARPAGPRRSSAWTATTCCSPRREEPTEIGLWSYGPGGLAPVARTAPGCSPGGGPAARRWSPAGRWTRTGVTVRVLRADDAVRPAARIASLRGNPEPAGPAARAAVPRPARGPHGAAVPVLARAGLRAAAGAAGPVRRPARAAGARGPRRLPDLAMVRRAGLRRADRGRPGHAGPRAGLGPGGGREPRRPGSGGPGRRAARGRGPVRRPGPGAGRDQGLVVRRVPVRAGRAAPPRRVPRGDRGRPGDRPAPVRHALHRAVPGRPGHQPRRLRQLLPGPGRRTAAPRPAARSGR